MMAFINVNHAIRLGVISQFSMALRHGDKMSLSRKSAEWLSDHNSGLCTTCKHKGHILDHGYTIVYGCNIVEQTMDSRTVRIQNLLTVTECKVYEPR